MSPLHAFRAPAQGPARATGRCQLSIETGRLCPVIAAGRTEEETEKRLGGAMLAGYPLISIDNSTAARRRLPLPARREPIVSVRALGSSKLYVIESRSTVFATGNNIQPTGDIIRRVIMGSLDPNMERPEQRKFRGDPVAAVIADRGKYIAAAMTIVGRSSMPKQPDPVKPLASFEDWSHFVRSALSGLERRPSDHDGNRKRGGHRSANAARFVAAWHEAAGFNNPMSAGSLKAFAEAAEVATDGEYHSRHEKIAHPSFHQAFLDCLAHR